ncbi:TetR/AcrR family transcriptional regulator [Crystallibacter crystallopoietes]|uniref:TetR/AcrR family transcriptional regulator n=1 Tax=Crystallibacter crystallopoietes TaxID=37928 RepID=UPI001ED9C430|nr:TetR family transcriptional regulator [Arthrobacter crystallopoietes]
MPAKERKEQLITATVGLMQREGVQAITLRDIAKEAEASLSSVHYCFSDKDELMAAAAEHWLQRMSRFSTDVPTNLGLRKAFEHVAEGYWGSLEEAPEEILAQVELVAWATRNAPANPLAAKIYPAYELELGKLFAVAAEESNEQCRMEFGALARAFIAIFDGAALQYMTDPGAADHRSQFFMMIDALLTKAGV